MEQSTNDLLLDLLDRPAFCVQAGTVTQANTAACQRLITPGIPVSDLLGSCTQAYAEFTGGCLYLTVTTADVRCGASVTRKDDTDIFVLDPDADPHLQAMALSSQQLRSPLQSVMTLADDMENSKQTEQLRRGLYQLQRIICNMADISRYQEQAMLHMESTDLGSVITETVEKAAALLARSQIRLHFTGLTQTVIGLADRELLERAVNNLISNAVKFSPKGSTLEAKLTCRGNLLSFSLRDAGEGIAPDVYASLFSRYLRQPGIEDGRYGMGLGLALVRTAAASHGGTVLIDQPEGRGTRVTMTISIRKSEGTQLRAPILLPISDYAGGRDHALLELSDCLSADVYQENM